MYFPEKTSENVVSTVQGVFQQLPQREGDRVSGGGSSRVLKTDKHANVVKVL